MANVAGNDTQDLNGQRCQENTLDSQWQVNWHINQDPNLNSPVVMVATDKINKVMGYFGWEGGLLNPTDLFPNTTTTQIGPSTS